MSDLNKGDKVAWNTPQGQTHGKITKKVANDKYEVKSDKSGKAAEHRGGSLDKH